MTDFQDVNLDELQRQLLVEMAEAFRTAPRGKRRALLSQTLDGTSLMHYNGPHWADIDEQDLDTLTHYGLLKRGFNSSGDAYFDVSPIGLQYYEWARQQAGDPVSQVEELVRGLVDSEWFVSRFATAHGKWSAAVEMLWADDADQHLSQIGHACREAMQEFAETLVKLAGLADQVNPDKAKTVSRVRAVLDARGLGGTRGDFNGALVVYWGELSDQVMRQEHAGQKEGEPIGWEDARRVVLHTMVVMYEIARSVEVAK